MRAIVTIITLLMALSLASIVAYVSVTGLMKLFAGAGVIGMTFFILIETSKIISTTLLHTFKDKVRGLLRVSLNIFIGITMMITSLGIYGFLSSTYKESFLKSENTLAEIELLQKKVNGYQEQLTFIVSEKTTVNETIGELSKGLSNNVIQYKDKETGQIITTTSSSTRKALEKQLDKAIDRQSILNAKSDSLNVIVFDVENEILEVKLSDDTATELGPLIFLSDVTGLSMDDVMKWFILLLIIIGDPLAVTMVVAFNKVIHKKKVEGLPMDSLIGDTLTDDEIIEKGRQLELDKVFKESVEIGKRRREKYGDEDEPTSLAFTNFYEKEKEVVMSVPDGMEFNKPYPISDFNTDYSEDIVVNPPTPNNDDSHLPNVVDDVVEEFDEDHALDMVMNNMVEDLMEEEGHETVGDLIESLNEDKEVDLTQFVSPGVSTREIDSKEESITEEVVNEITENSIDEQLEIDKSKVINLPKETQIEVIETPEVKEVIEVIPPAVENIVIHNKPPNKRMGIDRIR